MTTTRNDAALYSGMPATGSLLPKKTRERKEEAEAKAHAKPDPKADAVLSLIRKEMQAVSSTQNVLLDDKLTQEQKLNTIERMGDQYKFLSRLYRNMCGILGIKPPAEGSAA